MSENPQAFPHFQPRDPTLTYTHNGMTLRDYFAGQALIGLVGSTPPEVLDDIEQGVRGGKFLARGAYVLADALLAARSAS